MHDQHGQSAANIWEGLSNPNPRQTAVQRINHLSLSSKEKKTKKTAQVILYFYPPSQGEKWKREKHVMSNFFLKCFCNGHLALEILTSSGESTYISKFSTANGFQYNKPKRDDIRINGEPVKIVLFEIASEKIQNLERNISRIKELFQKELREILLKKRKEIVAHVDAIMTFLDEKIPLEKLQENQNTVRRIVKNFREFSDFLKEMLPENSVISEENLNRVGELYRIFYVDLSEFKKIAPKRAEEFKKKIGDIWEKLSPGAEYSWLSNNCAHCVSQALRILEYKGVEDLYGVFGLAPADVAYSILERDSVVKMNQTLIELENALTKKLADELDKNLTQNERRCILRTRDSIQSLKQQASCLLRQDRLCRNPEDVSAFISSCSELIVKHTQTLQKIIPPSGSIGFQIANCLLSIAIGITVIGLGFLAYRKKVTGSFSALQPKHDLNMQEVKQTLQCSSNVNKTIPQETQQGSLPEPDSQLSPSGYVR